MVLSNKIVPFSLVISDYRYSYIPKTSKMNLLFVQSTGVIYAPVGWLEAPHWDGCNLHLVNGYSEYGGIKPYKGFIYSTYAPVVALGSRLAPDVKVE